MVGDSEKRVLKDFYSECLKEMKVVRGNYIERIKSYDVYKELRKMYSNIDDIIERAENEIELIREMKKYIIEIEKEVNKPNDYGLFRFHMLVKNKGLTEAFLFRYGDDTLRELIGRCINDDKR